MAPVISPKKSWEGFAGSVVFTIAAGVALVTWLFDADWWVGVALGAIAVVMATLGDLCESVIKRDLGIKDMSQVIPGHGGLMDRLDSLLATVAPIWLVLYYLVF
jgi:phosphatidate cytidylyltransferase